LEIGAKIEMNSGHSDQSHVLRVVWRDPSMDLRRGWMGQTLRLKEGLQLSGEWVEIAEGSQSTTTVLPIDFPLCKKHGKRSLDFLFGNGGVANGEFNKLGVALDRDYPFLLSQGLESPLSCIAVDKGPPPSGASGWLGMFDHSDVLITDLRPGEIGAKPALIWQLISTAKEGFELGLNLAKSPVWGAIADLLEQEQRSINLEDGGAKAFIQRLEWAGLLIGLGE
jgi:alpha-mannosidase